MEIPNLGLKVVLPYRLRLQTLIRSTAQLLSWSAGNCPSREWGAALQKVNEYLSGEFDDSSERDREIERAGETILRRAFDHGRSVRSDIRNRFQQRALSAIDGRFKTHFNLSADFIERRLRRAAVDSRAVHGSERNEVAVLKKVAATVRQRKQTTLENAVSTDEACRLGEGFARERQNTSEAKTECQSE